MISILGRGLVLLALAFAATGMFVGFGAGIRKSPKTARIAEWCAYAFGASAIGANLLMIYALIARDFSVGYVAEVGSTKVPLHIAVVSLWASLNGSILFWCGILGLYTVAFTWYLSGRHREHAPWTIASLLAAAVFFTLLVSSVADPFHPMSPVPADGPGPNPLLQNHWMMSVHPPTLYLGYVGMAVPFAMCCGALLAGRLEKGWLVPMRRWTLIPYGFLSIGILMGGWWSYEVLGWGGYWAWDPVENASFLPWLLGTAFVHSMLVTERRGRMKTWTMLLGLGTFLLTLFGTFLTRSGVFNSVHSFTQSDIGPVFLVFMGVVFVAALVLVSFREHTLVTEGTGTDDGTTDVLGRETAILLQNITFTVFTAVVLLGTVYPMLREALDGTRVSVGEPWFDRWGLVLGTLIVFLMGVGPAMPWGRLSPDKAWARFVVPLVGGVLVAVVFAILGFTGPYTLLALFVSGFALVANVREYIEPVRARITGKGESAGTAAWAVARRGRRRFGGLVAHFGIIVATVSIALSKGYKVEHDFTLDVGETATLGAYAITYTGTRVEPQPHRDSRVATFDVVIDGRTAGILEPRLNTYHRMREPIGTPAVRTGPTTDLYLSLLQVDEAGGFASVRMMTMPLVLWLWLAGGIVALGVVMAAVPQRRRQPAPARAAEAVEATA